MMKERPLLIRGMTTLITLLLGLGIPVAQAHKPAGQPPKGSVSALVTRSSPPGLSQLTSLAQALRQAKSPQEARILEARAESLRRNALSPRLELLLSQMEAHLRAHNLTRAQDAINAALVLSVPNAFLRRKRAELRYLQGDLIGAVEDLGVSLNLDPNDPRAWELLSHVEEDRKAFKAARAAILHLKRLDPYANGLAHRLIKLGNQPQKSYF